MASTDSPASLAKLPLIGVGVNVLLAATKVAGGVFGKQVLVTGTGPIGALLIAGLRRAGAARIVAADLSDNALACARAMGADETLNLASHPDALAPYAKDKGQFDIMFEASGSDRALRAGLDVVVPRGVIVSVGMGGDAQCRMTIRNQGSRRIRAGVRLAGRDHRVTIRLEKFVVGHYRWP